MHIHTHVCVICVHTFFIRTYANKSKKINIVLLRKIAYGERRQANRNGKGKSKRRKGEGGSGREREGRQ